ncbi:hypothetical protein M758_5G158000 [Ceratodon purpureus]|nr:hypothetical protein M758_5G158000 [Ceratodon purpureus]
MIHVGHGIGPPKALITRFHLYSHHLPCCFSHSYSLLADLNQAPSPSPSPSPRHRLRCFHQIAVSHSASTLISCSSIRLAGSIDCVEVLIEH